jgi:hypothetical protein
MLMGEAIRLVTQREQSHDPQLIAINTIIGKDVRDDQMMLRVNRRLDVVADDSRDFAAGEAEASAFLQSPLFFSIGARHLTGQ